jgi:hypothetical protein
VAPVSVLVHRRLMSTTNAGSLSLHRGVSKP